jgi:hypothetical protein
LSKLSQHFFFDLVQELFDSTLYRYSGGWLHLQLGQKHRIPTLLGLLDKDIPRDKEDGDRVTSNISQTFITKCTTSKKNSSVAIMK